MPTSKAALECVDFVTLFEEDTPVETIDLLRPSVHVKGADYEGKDIPERATVEKHGGVPPYAETRDYVKQVMTLYRGDPRVDLSGLGNRGDFAPLRMAAASPGPDVARPDLPANHRKPRLIRGPNNRLLLTTSFSGSR